MAWGTGAAGAAAAAFGLAAAAPAACAARGRSASGLSPACSASSIAAFSAVWRRSATAPPFSERRRGTRAGRAAVSVTTGGSAGRGAGAGSAIATDALSPLSPAASWYLKADTSGERLAAAIEMTVAAVLLGNSAPCAAKRIELVQVTCNIFDGSTCSRLTHNNIDDVEGPSQKSRVQLITCLTLAS